MVDSQSKNQPSTIGTDQLPGLRTLPELLLYLFHHLQTCRPKDVPQHAEAIVPAVDAAHAEAFVAVLERRLGSMSAAQAARVKRVIQEACHRKDAKQG